MGRVDVRTGCTKYECHASLVLAVTGTIATSSGRGDTASTPVPRSALIRYRTIARFTWPGIGVAVSKTPLPRSVMGTVERGSTNELMSSTKYSTCTLLNDSVLENRMLTRTGWPARMMVDSSTFCTAAIEVTIGFGVIRTSALAA